MVSKPKPISNIKGEEVKAKKELMQEVSKRLSEIEKTKTAPKGINKDTSTPIIKLKTKPTNIVSNDKIEALKEQSTKDNKAEAKKVVVTKNKKVAIKSQSTKLYTKDIKSKNTTSTKENTHKKPSAKKAPSAKKKTIKKLKKETKQVNRGTSLDLIERFIKEEPSINKPEDKDYTSELDFAKNSLTDNYDIVSETMAKLYSKQGNKKKAKKIYEKLILIYPEKSTYFANRILNLEK